MTERIEVSARLAEWARSGGWGVSKAEDGRAMFWKEGGQLQYLLGRNGDGWFVITHLERSGPEFLVVAAPSMETVERYFFGDFGSSVRWHRRLPDVREPFSREELAPGFSLATRTFDGVENRMALIDSGGAVVAVSGKDVLRGTGRLVRLSVYVSATVDDIVGSFLDPEGKPLFSLR
ncbi:Imm61 family immunity protein [Mycobacterium kyorinense]|uniref:Immunity factor for TNT n=1 Tax=Mycobacterium kyorinense TaxID=487514 RepID=A0A1X1Y8Q8_9MYCO|nr:Imm61 family immunity protein [Mycobacterium kyorinense]ORW07487.1 hypothetical protein AWC14_24920 [Mycobacterium kyorinense]